MDGQGMKDHQEFVTIIVLKVTEQWHKRKSSYDTFSLQIK